ncbi:MAG: 50S ribosomal protein L15 [Paracholeplasma sp.]|jgi:large subunit ribosomal protein L15|uniref:Large ribosomal subunit protein uL15 n=1 Tax=Acholeplasma brassicae TaxID=61635 RepID=U4KSP0_9MOLU|nr:MULTISPECIES: 50S ribosomal protein L15 [Paracholeplasma]MDY3196071.1 50S ribosomal protein L15 [Paracholeplasma sp.]CCV65274.1 50S ribosomal protein L15 [Paracholeplasma brassicae]HBT59346.1 50S ribosomal protein L15 [Acholeplasmataceae bacterium]
MLNELRPNEGARKSRKRLGRGIGSGTGKTAGKGSKGQNARSGGGVRLGFEGGQIPFFQRLPKRGFTNVNRKEFAIVNLTQLNVFNDGDVVTPEVLLEKKIIGKLQSGVKVLANGTLEKKLTVKANHFSKQALELIQQAGGTAEVI